MKTWIITDTHFGHRKLEELCHRPKEFEKLIFKNLKQVGMTDTIIHLGDFCIGNDKEWHDKWRMALPGCQRILIKGNHDKKSNSWYRDNGWDFVCERVDDHFFGKYVTLSHEPIEGIQNLNIHGHTHGNAHRDEEHLHFYSSNHQELALEKNGYKPMLIEHLLAQENK